MQLSSAHKQRLGKVARIATAGAIMASSLGSAVAPLAHADQLTQHSTTLNNSRLGNSGGTSVTYSIKFRPVQTTPIDRVNFKICAEPDSYSASCGAVTGLNIGALTSSTVTGFGGGTGGTPTGDDAFTGHWDVTSAATEVTSTDHVLNFTGITNPTGAGTYYVRVQTCADDACTGIIDTGTSAFAILQSTIVSGTVLESLQFQVSAVGATTQCGTGAADTSTDASSSTTIPFGNFNSGTPQVSCHTVATGTNAVGGYLTTVKEFLGGSGTIGYMCRQTASGCGTDGSSSAAAGDVIADTGLNGTPAAWTNTVTFGLGVNANGGHRDTQFSTGNNHYRSMGGATPIDIANSTQTSTLAGSLTNIVYKADVATNQTAGVYQNRIMYVSTPRF